MPAMNDGGALMRHRASLIVIAAALAMAAAGFADPNPPSPTASPIAVVPTTAPTAMPSDRPSGSPDLGRPDPGPDAPTIAEPYLLGVGAPESSTIADANGTVTRQLHGMTYQVIEGGSVEDGIVLDGSIVGSVAWTVIDVDDGVDPLMEQVTAFNGETEQLTIDGIDVHYLRYPEGSHFSAYWWEPGHDRYLTVFVSDGADLEPLTEALIAR
ncbi:hypothetical protein BH20CHL7_BH20CHL7_17760 [soil metagenome]